MVFAIFLYGCAGNSTEQTRTSVSNYESTHSTDSSQSNQPNINDSEGTQIEIDGYLLSLNSSTSNNTTSSSNSANLIGSWKTTSKSGYWPYEIGSILSIKSNNSFTISPDGYGSYTLQGNTFTIDFGSAGQIVVAFNFSISNNVLRLQANDGSLNLTFERN